MSQHSGKENSPARQAARTLLNNGEKLGGARRSNNGMLFTVKKDDVVVAYIHVDIHNNPERRQPSHQEAHNKGKQNPPKKKK